jgi:hypothetical protein
MSLQFPLLRDREREWESEGGRGRKSQTSEKGSEDVVWRGRIDYEVARFSSNIQGYVPSLFVSHKNSQECDASFASVKTNASFQLYIQAWWMLIWFAHVHVGAWVRVWLTDQTSSKSTQSKEKLMSSTWNASLSQPLFQQPDASFPLDGAPNSVL